MKIKFSKIIAIVLLSTLILCASCLCFGCPIGDVNGDCVISLKDAIVALQLVSNTSVVQLVYKNSDVNKDGKIGLEDVIYILQQLSIEIVRPKSPEKVDSENILFEIEYKIFDYDMWHCRVGINKDGSKVLIIFENYHKIYALLYNNGTWEDPVLLGDNGNIWTSKTYHTIEMNDDGIAALLHYNESRIGTKGTFALSYFDGTKWIYTIEVEGIYKSALCDPNGIIYVVHQQTDWNPTTLTVSWFDNTGYLGSKEFKKEDGASIWFSNISSDSTGKIMLLYELRPSTYDTSRIGKTALYNGNEWVILSDRQLGTMLDVEGGVLKLYENKRAYLFADYTLSYQCFNYKNWHTIKEIPPIYKPDWFNDYSVAMNERGELMYVADENSLFIKSTGEISTAKIYKSNFLNNYKKVENSRMFYHRDGYFVVLWYQNSDDPKISYYKDDRWKTIIMPFPWFVCDGRYGDYTMNKKGYIVFATGNEYIGIVYPKIVIYKLVP